MKENEKQSIILGDANKNVTVVAGDFNISTVRNEFRPVFENPPLDEFEEGRYIIPAPTPGLLEILLLHNFLVLGGDGFDKNSLARYLAWKIQKEKPGGAKFEVIEWTNSKNPQNLQFEIQKKTEPAIFILSDISPQNVGYNLSKIYKSNRKESQFVIITTDNPPEEWKLGTDVQNFFWKPDPDKPFYSPKDLLMILIRELNKNRAYLPGEIQGLEFHPDCLLTENMELLKVAELLKTPPSIELFVRELVGIKTKIKEREILRLIEKCRDEKLLLNRWFYHLLTPKSQLMALGLCLFEGLFDDQFFAAMDFLYEKSWRQRNIALNYTDYCDLESLGNYYKLVEMDRTNDIRKVASIPNDMRKELLNVSWNSYRRHFISALPVLVELVRESVSHELGNLELFGNKKRQRRLRNVISETLCVMGLKPENSIENTQLENALLMLAADSNIDVQIVAAEAMASWRQYDQHEKLFDTLQRWQNKSVAKIVASFMNKENFSDQINSHNYILATVALSVGTAASYDPPGELNEKLCSLLEQLAAQSRESFIFQRFALYTLPRMTILHISQLRDTLLNLTQYSWLNEPIGLSMAMAYQQYPLEVLDILKSWFEQCKTNAKTQIVAEGITHRNAVLATIAYAYGYINFDESFGPIAFDDSFNFLQTMLKMETAPYIRNAVIKALIQQLSANFHEVEKYLKILLPKTTKEDRLQIVGDLVRIHLNQRQEWEQGDVCFEWNGSSYSVSLSGHQYQTEVEETMRLWLKNNKFPIQKKLALQFFSNELLVDFLRNEDNFIMEQKKVKKDSELSAVPPRISVNPAATDYETISFSMKIALKLAIFRDQYLLDSLRILLPEALLVQSIGVDRLHFALSRLTKDSDKDLGVLAEELLRAVKIVNNIALIVIVSIIIVAFLISKNL